MQRVSPVEISSYSHSTLTFVCNPAPGECLLPVMVMGACFVAIAFSRNYARNYDMQSENKILQQNGLSCRVGNFIRKDGQQEIGFTLRGTKEEREQAKKLLPHIRFREKD